MASSTISLRPTDQWLEDDIYQPNVPISEDTIYLLLEEIRQNYDIHDDSTTPEQTVEKDKDKFHSVLNEAIDDVEDAETTITSCASCSEEERIEDGRTCKQGQHLSMPGRYLTRYVRRNRELKYAYKHHAIIKEVKTASINEVEMELIHFSKRGDKLEINQTTEIFDLRNKEIYHVVYQHPRYEPDEIVRRAESQLSENRNGESQFGSYNVISCNCEHFATWCVVGGKGHSFQVEKIRQKIADAIIQIFDGANSIIQVVTSMLFKSPDEIAASINTAINGSAIALEPLDAIYLIYCIVMTVVHVRNYRKQQTCRSCLKGKLQDLWFTFAIHDATSVSTFVINNYALPLLGLGPFGVPLEILLVLLSTTLKESVPKIRRALQSPFKVDRNQISSLSSVDIGEIISFYYYNLEHVAVVTEVNDSAKQVTCVHYSLPSIWKVFGRRIVKEETFKLDPSNDIVKLFHCHATCKPSHEVVEHVRKRINETKWSIWDRSDHLCYWAKVKAKPRVPCVSSDSTDVEIRTSATFRRENVHLMTDLELGDVVFYRNKGILVDMISRDNDYGRRFEIEMVEYIYSLSWNLSRVKYKIDLNKDQLSVDIYHPVHCYPMETRRDRALALADTEPRSWWTTKSFIDYCIMRQQI